MQTASQSNFGKSIGPVNGETRKISLPEPKTMLTAAIITSGVVGAGIVAYYYMRARRK